MRGPRPLGPLTSAATSHRKAALSRSPQPALEGEGDSLNLADSCGRSPTPTTTPCSTSTMRREAHFVRNQFIKGEWADELVFALLEEEWQRVHQA
jgi:hypothetical protein